MRYIVLALAFCFTLAPLDAAIHKPQSSSTHLVKARKSRFKARKSPKRKIRQRHGVN